MKLYDLSKNRIVQFPDYIAKIKLRRKHISQGGIYCSVAEISKYISTPPTEYTPPKYTPPVSDLETTEASWEEEDSKPLVEESDAPKRGRKRKPKS